MKKFATRTLILSVLMIAMLALSAFGAFAAVPAPSTNPVTGTYGPGATADTVYAVDVTFGSMAFTYTAASQGEWDPDDLDYTGATTAAWTCAEGANKVTVTNKSNTDVAVAVTYAAATGYEAITGTVANGSFNLASAVGKTATTLDSKVATLTLAGELAASATIGTVTVTISAAAQ